MLDLWLDARNFASEHGIPFVLPRMVSPSQLYGIETEFYAHELASVAVWIGFLQRKHQLHGLPLSSSRSKRKLLPPLYSSDCSVYCGGCLSRWDYGGLDADSLIH